MKTKITITIIIIIAVITIIFFLGRQQNSGSLISPAGFLQKSTPVPTAFTNQTPTIFQFDSSTDLKMELEKVNPQILDSDFE